jgi:hypothetical protein
MHGIIKAMNHFDPIWTREIHFESAKLVAGLTNTIRSKLGCAQCDQIVSEISDHICSVHQSLQF